MKKRYFLATLFCVFTLAGCARTAPVLNVSTPITAQYSGDQVKRAILQAGLEREWIMTPTAPGVINGHIDQRGHVADIRINYSSSGYSITYVNSQNLLAAQGNIHRNYNRWINNLNREIQLKLAAEKIQ